MEFYSFRHLLIIITCLILPILWAVNLKKDYKILKSSILLLFVLEILRVLFLIITGDFEINKDLSLQLCFTYAFIGIIYLIKPKNYILSFMGAFGILYGFAAIVLMDPNPFLSFNIIQGYIYHSVLVFIGTYIIKYYNIIFTIKSILIIWIQIIIGMIANIVIKNGSNYIFLNSFLMPNYHLPYAVNIEVFNMPIFGNNSFNNILISVIDTLGDFWYAILFGFIITFFSSLWLYIIYKIKKIKD